MKPSSKERFSLTNKLLQTVELKAISDRLVLRGLFIAVIASAVWLGLAANAEFIEITPTDGGTLIEGVIGTPRFINPALAITRADQDVSALIYSGLMKIDPDGNLVPDAAEEIAVSDDGRTYHIKLKQNVRFHDGTPLTARDVAYTITLIQNPDLKSPLRGNWNGVLVEELGEYELNIVIEEAYQPFIENFTIGILPRHIWDQLPIEQLPFSQHNTEPIGSGPFKMTAVERNDSGLVSSYTLERFPEALATPKLDSVVLRFYKNEETLVEAFDASEITSAAGLPAETVKAMSEKKYQTISTTLPRTFGIFFNQSRSAVVRDEAAREALNLAIDRQMLVDDVLGGFGVPTTHAVPSDFGGVESSSTTPAGDLDLARTILIDGDWEQAEDGTWEKDIDDVPYTLAITLRTANNELFESTANDVAQQWRELGVLVNVEQYEQTDLLQAVIRPRDFEALLFGTDLGRSVDLYPFWHSSQKDDPGLNIAQYTNIDVDTYLETARTSEDMSVRNEAQMAAEMIIDEELPAIFLYHPTLTYVVSQNVTLSPIIKISRPHERFMNIEKWHAETGAMWPLFQNKN